MPVLGAVLLIVWVILLIRIPRIMLPASIIIIAIAALLAVAVGLWQWRHEKQVARVEITVQYQPESCDFGKPLQVTLHNTGPRTTSQISWQLRAVQPGYNTNLLDTGVTRNTYQLDRPLHADEQWQACYPVPPLRSGYRAGDLQYHADQVRAEFQR